tara:strand:+ start:677 stop:1987 length:1311 start_codon:yes stop_codon:yes gene_type:complete
MSTPSQIFRLLFFICLYLFATRQDIFSLFAFFLCILGLSFYLIKESSSKNLEFKLISFFLALLIPLGLPQAIKNEYLPSGYGYMIISIMSSILILVLNDGKDNQLSFRNKLLSIFTASLAPTTYLSGPSATINDIKKSSVQRFGLPVLKSLRNFNYKLAISGLFRISIGFYLATLDNVNFENILNLIFSFSIVSFLSIILFGFYNFWKYYLLFSGASELCKSLLTIFEIDIIDNFSKPEDSVFYHEIWSKWHLNITDRVRNYLFTPISLFALRRASKLNEFFRFLVVEGLPIATLFLILAVWHGARPRDFIYAFASTFLTMLSRGLSKNKLLKVNLSKSLFFEELFRFSSISIFGLALSIYDISEMKVVFNITLSDLNDLVPYFFLSLVVYVYYKFRDNFKMERFVIALELISIIYLQIFVLASADFSSDFIYFAS